MDSPLMRLINCGAGLLALGGNRIAILADPFSPQLRVSDG